MAAPLQTPPRHIVVGIDFGTTFTGVAYAESLRPDRIRVIQVWPSHTGKDELSGKIPTKLRYTNDGPPEWGALISPDAPRDEVLEFFKLALDKDHIAKLQGDSTIIQRNLTGQDIDKIITDYLACICTYSMQYLRRPTELGPAIVNTTPFRFVLTVPAIWSERARERTADALRRAMKADHNTTVIMISEPEAAASRVLLQAPRNDMNRNDCFIVVDAGGGTVDLISYRIVDFYPTLQVSEAVAGSGGACGSAFLNERFERLIRSTLGNEDGFDHSIVQQALNKWERNVKKRFSMEDLRGQPETFDFDVTGLEDNRALNVRRSRWTIKASDVFRIFDGVVLQVLRLVTDQRAATQVDIKAVLLVGGFGQSRYLRERLEDSLKPIPVLQPENAWTAVVEGAVMRGLSDVAPERQEVVTVVDRKARKHYGYEVSVAFSDQAHAQIASSRRWDSYMARWEVDVVQWFLKKGDAVTESRPFTKQFSVHSKVAWGRPKLILLPILSDSNSDVAPLARNDDVTTLCVAEADLSHIPDDQVTQSRGKDGQMYYIVDCQIEIRYESASTAYTLLHKGQRYNTVHAEYV